MQVAEKMVGYQKRLGEYPTNLTQTKVLLQCSLKDCFRAGDRGTLYEAFQLLRVSRPLKSSPTKNLNHSTGWGLSRFATRRAKKWRQLLGVQHKQI